MPEAARNRSVVRILGKDDIWRGCGFLTPDGYVVTCAHVVGDALGNRELAKRKDPPRNFTVQVQFPTSERQEPFPARVVPTAKQDYGWAPMDATKQIEDIAVLEIIGGPPKEALAVVLTARKPPSLVVDFMAFGMPDRSAPRRYYEEPGGWANGQFTDEVANQLIEVQSITKAPAGFVRPGCSGAAAWSKSLDAAVGMVSMADVAREVALIKPVHHLRQIWPTLDKALVGERLQLTGGEATLLTLIDRTPQELPFNRELKRHFGEQVDQTRMHAPLFCVVKGHRREGHDHLRTRFAIRPLSDRHVLNAEIEMVGINWDCYGMDVAEGLWLLTEQLAERLKAASDTPEAVRAAINLAGQPRFFYTTIDHVLYREQDAELIRSWIEYWGRVGGSPPQLTSECYVFLSFTYDPVSDADTELARFCRDRLGSLLKPERAIDLPALSMVQAGHVPTWFDTVLATLRSDEARRRAEQKRVKIVTSVESLFQQKGEPSMHMSELIERARDLAFDL